MRGSSLATRLFLSATAWVVVILLLTGVVLSSVYRAATERAFDRRLNLYLRTLIAEVATPDEPPERQFQSLGEPLFDLPLSGWYWQITRTGRVAVDGNPVKLTSHEYRLLSYLMHHAGRVVSRTELVEHLYDQDFDRDSNTIEVFVGRIRKKLDVDIIQTVRGLGYLLTPPPTGA